MISLLFRSRTWSLGVFLNISCCLIQITWMSGKYIPLTQNWQCISSMIEFLLNIYAWTSSLTVSPTVGPVHQSDGLNLYSLKFGLKKTVWFALWTGPFGPSRALDLGHRDAESLRRKSSPMTYYESYVDNYHWWGA